MEPWVVNIIIFVLAVFVGDHVIRGVTPALHTPLMALTNALSGIIIVGALLEIGSIEGGDIPISAWLAALAALAAAINIFGGFMVSERMLAMYKKRESR